MNRREAIAAILAGPVAGIRAISAQSSALTSLTIAEALTRLAARDFTPVQLANAYLARIAELNTDLNAYVTVTRDLALREAKSARPGSRLYGIPIAHKDLLETRGVLTTAGSLLFEDHIPDTNAVIVQQLEDAGAVLLGKTNTHELGGGVTTINPFYGTTRNPIDRTRIPGGSSGGSAAAVAAHLCMAATGSDTGGSVRIPAAFCGVVGFKPTFGRLSTQGLIGSVPTFDHVGFLTRTVEDAQILLTAVLPTDSLQTSSVVPSGVRVGVARNFFFDALEPVVAAAVERELTALKSRGALVDDVTFPITPKTTSEVFDPIVVFEIWGRFGADWRTSPGSFSKEFSAFFDNDRPTVGEYEAALAALQSYQAAVDRVFDAVDVVVTPTVPMTAPPIAGPIDGTRILRNTWPFNAAGTPTISVPLPASPLPIGLQITARRGDDDKLLRIARTLGTSS